jgi:pyridoxine/pyridoxamine 5'-phosphate oxidase
MLERQVMVIGKAERLSTLEVVKYFHSRPRDSQIGAWVSKQSSRISARGILESKFLELKQKFRCRASGADSASALSRWSSGRGENTVCTIAFYTSAIAAPGK